MNRSIILRGASAGALSLVFLSAADAQEALPTIDIGSSERQAASRAPAPGRGDPAKETGYARSTSSSATRTDTPLINTPASVQIIPHEVIQDKQIFDTIEATKNVSGVQIPSVFFDTYAIRGFSTIHTFRNGQRLPEWLVGAEEVAFTDRVEVVKGPASVLYGRIEPGGFVNIVTKKPQENFKASLETQFGSWGLSRTTVDVTGPANDEKTLLYRVIGVFDHRDSFVDFEHRNNGAVALFLTYRPIERLEINAQYEHYEKRQTSPSGDGTVPVFRQWDRTTGLPQVYPGLNDRPIILPRHFSASDPSLWNSLPFVDHRHVIAYDWTYRIDDKWKVTQRFQYLLNYEAENYLGNYNQAFDGTNIYRTFVRNDANRSAISTSLDVSGEIETGPLTHKVLVGLDWFRTKIDYPGFNGGDAFIHQININAPIYGDIGGVLQYLAGTSRNNMIYRTNWSDFGVYAQDQISAFDDRLHILLGGRWDKTYSAASQTYGGSWESCYPGCSGYPMRQFPDKPMLSPRAAVLFKLQDNVSIYGSYVRSLGANNSGSVIDGTRPPPEVGRQWEVGVKTRWLDDRLSASVALFDLRKTNILQADLAHPGLVIPVGEVASRGVEFDLAGKLTENLSLIGSYTFDSAKIIDDNYNGNAGKRYNRVAPNVGNLWVKWDNAPGLPKGWEVGAGFYAVDERYGVNDNSWKVPGYVTFDTMMAYRLPVDGHKVTFRFNVKNLTDRKYFDYLDGYAFASYGQPRTFIGSINVAW